MSERLQCPACNALCSADALGCGICGTSFGVEPHVIRAQQLNDPISVQILGCTVLGGSGFPLTVGSVVALHVTDDAIVIHSGEQEVRSLSAGSHLVDFDASGPGKVTTGLHTGFFFNDFESFARGFIISELLNRLLQRTTIHTLLTITSTDGELFLHHGGEEPGSLRIKLSALYTSLRLADSHRSSAAARA